MTQGQFHKLLILLNACWWISGSFAFWNYASAWPDFVQSTVVVLGVLAAVGNFFFWAGRIFTSHPFFFSLHRVALVIVILSTITQAGLLLSFLFA